ncbi:MAG: DUF494 family protein [Legionella sp.]|nr:DUF494 family protein [Legionella sp.]
MKENLLTLLIDLLKKNLAENDHSASPVEKKTLHRPQDSAGEIMTNQGIENSIVTHASSSSDKPLYEATRRLLMPAECHKLTKASYQFLLRFLQWHLITPETFELIVQQLLSSESRLVSLQETKWAIRKNLETTLDPHQLAFLDLILYHSEDKVTRH